jgi:hypothetical protein
MVSRFTALVSGARAAKKSFHLCDLLNAPLVSAAFKRRFDPDGDDVEGLFLRYHSGTEGQKIGIVVPSGKYRCLLVPAESASDSRHLVRCDGLPVARTPKNNPQITLFIRHSFGGRANKFGVINGIIGVGPKILHLVTKLGEKEDDSFLVVKTCMIGADSNSHGS